MLTNVSNPRSQVVRRSVYERTVIGRGASIGANATIVCGVNLGRYCFVAAGAVVTSNVPDYALMMGVPAKQKGWMSRHGHILTFDENRTARCPESGLEYRMEGKMGRKLSVVYRLMKKCLCQQRWPMERNPTIRSRTPRY